VQDIIDNIKNQSIRPRSVSDDAPMAEEIPSKTVVTPHQDQKMNHYDEARMRGLETSEMTCVYDKENIQINKPKKGRQHVALSKKPCEEFTSEVQAENEGQKKCSLERQPLKCLDQKKDI
jgi:hypothetical protein